MNNVYLKIKDLIDYIFEYNQLKFTEEEIYYYEEYNNILKNIFDIKYKDLYPKFDYVGIMGNVTLDNDDLVYTYINEERTGVDTQRMKIDDYIKNLIKYEEN